MRSTKTHHMVTWKLYKLLIGCLVDTQWISVASEVWMFTIASGITKERRRQKGITLH